MITNHFHALLMEGENKPGKSVMNVDWFDERGLPGHHLSFRREIEFRLPSRSTRSRRKWKPTFLHDTGYGYRIRFDCSVDPGLRFDFRTALVCDRKSVDLRTRYIRSGWRSLTDWLTCQLLKIRRTELEHRRIHSIWGRRWWLFIAFKVWSALWHSLRNTPRVEKVCSYAFLKSNRSTWFTKETIKRNHSQKLLTIKIVSEIKKMENVQTGGK